MKEETVCINGRFCWKKKMFSAWDDILSENDDFMLLEYRNEIADFLIGDGECYFELHIGSDVFEKFKNIDAVCRKNNDIYFVSSETTQEEKFTDINEALNRLNGKTFSPKHIYYAGQGQLEDLLNSQDSVLLILPFWRYRDFKDGVWQIRSEEFNKDGVNRWNRMFFDRSLTRELRKKRVSNLIKFKQYSFALRCGAYSSETSTDNAPCCNYSFADYRADGLCFVLGEKTQTAKDINDFIEYYSELAVKYGIDSFFLKNRDRYEAVFTEGENQILQGENALQILFSYLHDLYNGKYSSSEPNAIPLFAVPYIEEEIERDDIKYCGSFCGAMAFYQTKTPVRRSMWYRINNPQI